MTHAGKLEHMRKHMAALGVSPWTAAPPLWRLLWRMGIEVPPPLFLGFWPLALATGTGFGVGLWAFMWLLPWTRQDLATGHVLGAFTAAGALFGLAMASWFRHIARKYGLPSWADYAGTSGGAA